VIDMKDLLLLILRLLAGLTTLLSPNSEVEG
jgi:hypothetical protein